MFVKYLRRTKAPTQTILGVLWAKRTSAGKAKKKCSLGQHQHPYC